MHVLLVHNAEAGDGRFDRESLQDLIRAAGHTVTYAPSGASWRDIVERRRDLDVIVAAGGDGTVAKVARATVGRGIPIAVIPLGTANNIAGALGLSSRAVPDLVAGWTDARRQRFDVGIASAGQRYQFLESVGVGLLATTIARIVHGDAAFVDELDAAEDRLEAAMDVLGDELSRLEPVHVDLELDGRSVTGDFILVEVLNFGGAGANLRLACDADPADGRFDVVTVDEAGRRSLLDHLPLYRTDPARAPRLQTCRARQVRLACEGCLVHLDDKLLRRQAPEPEPIELRLAPDALTFLV
jgi:diacylglycerol kinase (ATP)